MIFPFPVRHVHFLGVGGVSLSSFARFFAENGFSVSGTDAASSPVLDELREKGVRVWCGFEPALTGRPDLVVYTSAISPDDPELTYLRSCGVRCLERYALFPYLTTFFRSTVAIAGTHGKTTVTAMCAHVLRSVLPLYAHVGGRSVDFGSYLYTGNDLLLTEACEYRKSFLALRPTLGVVLNAEVDHPDTYRDVGDVYDAFDDFLRSSSLSLVGEGEYYRLRQASLGAVSFGFSSSCTFRGVDVKQYENGSFGCRILRDGEPLFDFQLRIPGKHILFDAIGAAATCLLLGAPAEAVANALSSFRGVERRFSYKGSVLNVPVYVDYAHHPTAIDYAIRTARLFKKTVTVVFQPHTYSRTARLKEEFLNALSLCDALIVVKEYAARETPRDGCSALALFRSLKNDVKYYADSLVDAAALVRRVLSTNKTAPDPIVLILGAGDVCMVADLVVDR